MTRTFNARRSLGTFLGEFGLLAMLLILMGIFTTLNPTFLTFANLRTVLEQNAALAIVAVGMTFAIISRNIDLSPGSMIALTGVIIAIVFTATGSIYLGILAGLATSIGIYLFNGSIVARLGINALIVTLAAWIWARGLAISLTRADSIVVRDPFIDFMNTAQFLGISPPIVLIALSYLLGWFLLHRTRLGRYTFAIGGDERAAIEAGVDTVFWKIVMFGVMGFFVALGAVLTLSKLGTSAPDAAYGLELDAIVAVIIGGNPFQGGYGSLRRTLIGVLFIAILNNGLNNLGMRDSYFYLYKGIAIILALFFDVLARRLLRGQEVESTFGDPLGNL